MDSTSTSAAGGAAAADGLSSIENELQKLLKEFKQSNHKSRSILQPRHAIDFPDNSLFHQLARAVCQARVIPRKELYECWSTALIIHHYFPRAKRIADLACSHGLLSWSLLVLAVDGCPTPLNEQADSFAATSTTLERSVVCVDLVMPPSVEKLEQCMLEKWPILRGSWDYVEGPVEAVDPDESTLLVAIHACGNLSDKAIHLALQGGSPLVLVPCCHSKKLLPSLQQGHDDPGIDLKNGFSFVELIDRYRAQRVRNFGYSVQETEIPQEFTPKNHVLLAFPPVGTTQKSSFAKLPIGKGGPLWSSLKIPVADSVVAKRTVRAMGGRAASEKRKSKPPPVLSISLALPSTPEPRKLLQDISEEQLQAILSSGIALKSRVEAQCPDPFWSEREQCYARTFDVRYHDCKSKAEAKECHRLLRLAIPRALDGVIVRYAPKKEKL